MQSLTFVLEATLLAPLVEFAMSSSGHVEPRQGLALGWLSSVVAGLAVVFGTAERVQAVPADECHGISEGAGSSKNCSWICLDNQPCAFNNKGQPIKVFKAKYCNSESYGCTQEGSWSCSCIA